MASKSERTKAFIIEKTSPIFNKKGVAGTSLSDITEATGLTKGAVYGNFEDKDAVAVAAFEHNVDRVFTEIGERMAKEATSAGTLKAITEYYRSKYADGRMEYGCPMANTATEADDTHPLLHAKVRERYMKWRRGIEKMVLSGIETGQFKSDVDATAFAYIMIATIQGCMMVAKTTGEGKFAFVPLDMLDEMIDSFKK